MLTLNKTTVIQFFKYGLIGGASTFLGWAVFNFFIYMTNTAQGLIINLFSLIAFIVSRLFSFFWTKYWVFKHYEKDTMGQQVIKFFAISGALTLLNLFIIHVGVNVIGPSFGISPVVWSNIFFLLTIFPSVFGNFFGYKFLVFKTKNLPLKDF